MIDNEPKELVQFRELQKKKYDQVIEDNALAWIHHKLMKEYGWIPLDEFLDELPYSHSTALLQMIALDNKMQAEAEKEAMKKSKHKRN